jgi:AraC-like DNA-binding protein
MDFHCQNFSCNEIVVLPLENPQACIQDFEKLQSLQLYNKSKLKLYSIFYELLYKVAHSSAQTANPLHGVMKYIEQHVQDPGLSNTTLATHMGISEVYLRKQFLAHCQTTPKQYILDMRLRKAKQLLVDTAFTVAAIAEECGFASVYHFCRAFKQRTGLTPTQYAAANRIHHI